MKYYFLLRDRETKKLITYDIKDFAKTEEEVREIVYNYNSKMRKKNIYEIVVDDLAKEILDMKAITKDLMLHEISNATRTIEYNLSYLTDLVSEIE